MKRQILLFATIVSFLGLVSCSETSNTNDKVSTKVTKLDTTTVKEPIDVGYTVIKTTTLTTGTATKQYTSKDRKDTQFALDQSSRKEVKQKFIIKLSDSKVLIYDPNNKLIKELSVIKHWTDDSGPSTVYDLKDKDGVDYSLDHYIDTDKKNFLSFRYGKSLNSYSDEN